MSMILVGVVTELNAELSGNPKRCLFPASCMFVHVYVYMCLYMLLSQSKTCRTAHNEANVLMIECADRNCRGVCAGSLFEEGILHLEVGGLDAHLWCW